MKRISDNPYVEELKALPTDNSFTTTRTLLQMEAEAFTKGYQAQLESCEEQHKEKVRELFEEIESPELIPNSEPVTERIIILSWDKWQSLKAKYLEETDEAD